MNLKKLISDWKGLDMKWKLLSGSGAIFPLVVLGLFFYGCHSVDQKFLNVMDKTNSQMMIQWEKAINNNPVIKNLPQKTEKEKKYINELVLDLMAAGHVQRLAID